MNYISIYLNFCLDKGDHLRLSSQDKGKRFNNLMHLFNEEALTKCYQELDVNRAVGTDGMDKSSYSLNLTENIRELVKKLKNMVYKPGNILEVKIPKEGSPGKYRTLGISNFEDKLCQKMMKKVLENIYEPLFLKCSYGFRAGIGCHDAVGSFLNIFMKMRLRA
ncbi:reverse transcriptase domain-containing protein [Rickettsia endosymbiont of Oedothorax gibbosus]|uniref:reverse transcriptase domain-containing protein n=1 Tax=Rickettsia endosymbiont of Oedothorax gibbosus TaxID=931099 RepID=UPI0032AF93F7